MIRFLRLLVMLAVISLVTIVSGCTFSAPQFQSAIAMAQGIITSDDATSGDEPARWFASVGVVGAVLNPYVSNDLIVFANKDGDAIAFDGWTIRSVVGFGLSAPISISGKEGLRNFSGRLERYSTNCDPWVLDGLVWTQSCGNGDGLIELNEAGNIKRIILSLGKEQGNVTLRTAR